MSDKLFERATRKKLRFYYKGAISVENLWDLNLNELDSIHGKLKAEEKEQESTSLLKQKNTKESDLKLAIDIVEYIFNYKQSLIEKKEAAIIKKQEKERIESLIARKKDAALEEKSIEELEKMLKEGD